MGDQGPFPWALLGIYATSVLVMIATVVLAFQLLT